jgi:hypothetical protein
MMAGASGTGGSKAMMLWLSASGGSSLLMPSVSSLSLLLLGGSSLVPMSGGLLHVTLCSLLSRSESGAGLSIMCSLRVCSMLTS